MPNLVARLEIGLNGNGVSANVGAQVGQLGAVGQAASALMDGETPGLATLRGALTELQIAPPELGGDLPGRFLALANAVPTDLSPLTTGLLAPLESIRGSVGGDLVAVLERILAVARAISDLTRVRFTCEDEGGATAGTGTGTGAGAGAGSGGPGSGGASGSGAGSGGGSGTPTPVERATAQVTLVLGLLPDPLDVPGVMRGLHALTAIPARDEMIPLSIPVLDDLRDPLDTLVTWEELNADGVRAHLAASLGQARAFLDGEVNAALEPLARVGELAAHVDTGALAQIAGGLTARLGELRAAVNAGDLSGTGPAVQAIDALLDQWEALRPGLQADVLAHLTSLEDRLEALPDDLEDAAEHVVSVLRPPGTLPVPALPAPAQDALAGLESFLDQVFGWLQDLADALDVSAVQEPLSEVADSARAVAEGLQGGVVGLRMAVESLFGRVDEAMGGVDPAALADQVRAAIEALGHDLTARLQGLFAPVRDAVHQAVQTVSGTVDALKLEEVKAAVQGALQALEDVFGDPDVGTALQSVHDALSAAAAFLETASFAPVTDQVVQAIDGVRAALEMIDPAMIPAPAQSALDAAVSVLPPDLRPITLPLIEGLGALVESGPLPLVDTVREQAYAARATMQGFQPAAALEPLVQPYGELLDRLDAFTPSSVLEPVGAELDALKDRLRESADPGALLAPLHEPFQRLLAAFDALDPASVVAPVAESIEAVVDEVLEALPVDEALAEIESVFAVVERAVRSAGALSEMLRRVREPLDVFGGTGALEAWIDGIVAKIEAPGDIAALTAALGSLTASVDGTRAAALSARAAAALDPPLAALTALDGPARVAAVVQADASFPRAKLDTLAASAERTAVAAALARVSATSPTFGTPFQRLHEWRAALAAAKAALDARLAGWDAAYHAPGAALDALRRPAATPAELRAGVRAELQAQFVAPVAALFALAAPVRTALDTFLSRLEPLVTALTGKVEALLLGPQSLHAVVQSASRMVETLRALDLDFVTEGVRELFADVREKLAALDPAKLGETLTEAFGDMLNAISLSLLIPDADVQAIDDAWQQVIDTLRALDPGALVREVDELYREKVLPLLELLNVAPLLENIAERMALLDDELRAELERVNMAYQAMLAAVPDAAGGGGVSVSASFSAAA
jgi:hypothetical protein